jgi:MoxR-like ATPase
MKKETLDKIFEKALEKKKAIIIVGNFGVGKSQLVYEFAEKKANELKKKLIIWHQLSEEEKKRFIEDKKLREESFILVDIKLQSVGDISKISGIPIIVNGNNEHKVFWELPSFLKVLAYPESSGVLFLDEINMASPSLQSISFELLLQRKVGEWKLSDNVLILGAGNNLEVNISANVIPKPLINRVIFLKFDGFDRDTWIEWAVNKNLDSRIIAFVKAFGDLIVDADEELEQSSRPRSYELLSDMIKDEEDLDYIEEVAKGLLHKSSAERFVNFLKHMKRLDYEKYIKEPEAFKGEKGDIKYAIITIISKNIDNIKAKDLANFVKAIADSDAEFCLLLFTLLRAEGKKNKFKEIVKELPEDLTNRFFDILV